MNSKMQQTWAWSTTCCMWRSKKVWGSKEKKLIICRVSGRDTRQRNNLCRVPGRDTRQRMICRVPCICRVPGTQQRWLCRVPALCRVIFVWPECSRKNTQQSVHHSAKCGFPVVIELSRTYPGVWGYISWCAITQLPNRWTANSLNQQWIHVQIT